MQPEHVPVAVCVTRQLTSAPIALVALCAAWQVVGQNLSRSQTAAEPWITAPTTLAMLRPWFKQRQTVVGTVVGSRPPSRRLLLGAEGLPIRTASRLQSEQQQKHRSGSGYRTHLAHQTDQA